MMCILLTFGSTADTVTHLQFIVLQYTFVQTSESATCVNDKGEYTEY